MFGIGGSELMFIIFIALMLFGSDKIPDIARAMGKGMAQLKNATNEIKSEIQKGAEANGIDTSLKELTSGFTTEVEKVKESLDTNITSTLEKTNQDIEELTGPIKRQL
jgi:sec-independent protein translocase protein TatA